MCGASLLGFDALDAKLLDGAGFGQSPPRVDGHYLGVPARGIPEFASLEGHATSIIGPGHAGGDEGGTEVRGARVVARGLHRLVFALASHDARLLAVVMVIYKGVPVVLVVIDGKAGEIGIESNAFLALIGDLGLVLGNADQLILVAALFFLQEDVSAVRGLCLVQHRVGEDYFPLLRVDVMETASASGKEKSCSKRENFVEHRDTWVIEEDRALLDGFKPVLLLQAIPCGVRGRRI